MGMNILPPRGSADSIFATMPLGRIILVETSSAGNLGAAMRVAANFGVPRLDLVRPQVDPGGAEVLSWACGAGDHLDVLRHDSLPEALDGVRTSIATASGRGRDNQPLSTPDEAADVMVARGTNAAALVFGNETSGLCRDDLDRCDCVVRIPTRPEFPVLNLTQSIAILLAHLSMHDAPPPPTAPEPAPASHTEGFLQQAEKVLVGIGFLDPQNPQRILRKMRRIIGRAGLTENEVAILRGICRQVEWAARTAPLADPDHRGRYSRSDS
jgi:tRNA/rRNA methyltransferase